MLIQFSELFAPFKKIKGIVHCGSSTGQERQHYADMGINKVIWIEAIPEVYDELVSNLKNYPNQIAVNACLGEVDGRQVTFNVSNNEAQSSSFLQLKEHKVAHPEVHYVRTFETTTKTLRTVLKEAGINESEINDTWVLVGDLQGAELLMLQGASDLLTRFGFCYLEVNTKEVYESCALKPELDAYLLEHGFEPFAQHIYEHWGWGDCAYKKKYL